MISLVVGIHLLQQANTRLMDPNGLIVTNTIIEDTLSRGELECTTQNSLSTLFIRGIFTTILHLILSTEKYSQVYQLIRLTNQLSRTWKALSDNCQLIRVQF